MSEKKNVRDVVTTNTKVCLFNERFLGGGSGTDSHALPFLTRQALPTKNADFPQTNEITSPIPTSSTNLKAISDF